MAFAPTKGDRPEWVVQKLTELGVDRIVPLQTARSVVRWEGERGRRAVDRLEPGGPGGGGPVPPDLAARGEPGDRPWTAWPRWPGRIPSWPRPGGAPPGLDRPVVAVGPEGGWDDEERARFPGGVGLGPTVLRAETAAVAAGTLLCALRSGLVGPLA